MTPCCYFPTTPLMLDDEYEFLFMLPKLFHQMPFPYVFLKAKHAMEFIKKEYQSVIHADQWAKNVNAFETDLGELENEDHPVVSLDIFSIHQIAFNPARFKELAIALIDYDMVPMDGLTFCHHMAGYPFQKLLLTGEASITLGIEAFNKEEIEQFIDKGITPTFTEDLNAVMRKYERRYFEQLSAPIFSHLSKEKKSALGEPKFEKLFNEVIEQHKIIEYYLVHESGCYLMVDIEGRVSFFVIKSEDDMKYYDTSARDNEAPKPIIQKLKSRSHVLFLFSSKDNREIPYEKWGSYLHKAKKFKGQKNTFYYAYIPSTPVYSHQLKKIASYKQYLIKDAKIKRYLAPY